MTRHKKQIHETKSTRSITIRTFSDVWRTRHVREAVAELSFRCWSMDHFTPANDFCCFCVFQWLESQRSLIGLNFTVAWLHRGPPRRLVARLTIYFSSFSKRDKACSSNRREHFSSITIAFALIAISAKKNLYKHVYLCAI